MLGVELRIIIHLGVIEPKQTIRLPDLNIQIRIPGKELVVERPVYTRFSHVVDLVYYSLDADDFIQQDLGYEMFVGEVGCSEVEMRWNGGFSILGSIARIPSAFTYMSDGIETMRMLFIALLWNNRLQHLLYKAASGTKFASLRSLEDIPTMVPIAIV